MNVPFSGLLAALIVTIAPITPVGAEEPTAQDPPLVVAFVADQGTGIAAREVLQLVNDQGVDLLLLQGDLGYGENTAGAWVNNIEQVLGPDFPVLLVVGNHEEHQWPLYKQWLANRIARIGDLQCEGDVGVKAYCRFRGLGIVQVSPGIREVGGVSPDDDYPGFIARSFENDPHSWRVCSWHKNMRDMQIGRKGDSTGWGVYQACLNAGALVATGHEHSYSRTYLMNDFQRRSVVHRNSHLEIGPGQSFAFVSGLGGLSIRTQELDGDWWAAKYSASQNAAHGALICRFQAQDARCEFKAIDGAVPDTFTLRSLLNAGPGPAAPDAAPGTEAPQPQLQAESQEEPQADTAAMPQDDAQDDAQADAQAEPQAAGEAPGDVEKPGSSDAPGSSEQPGSPPSQPTVSPVGGAVHGLVLLVLGLGLMLRWRAERSPLRFRCARSPAPRGSRTAS